MKFLWIFLAIFAVITQIYSLPPQPTKKSAIDTSDSDEIQNRVLFNVAVIKNCKEGFVLMGTTCRRLISRNILNYGMCAKNKVFIDGRCQTHIRDFLQFS
jgi:hypothetical protein